MFASDTQATIAIPPALTGGSVQTATIRKLTGRECERAQAADLRGSTIGAGAVRRWHETVKRKMAEGLPESEAGAASLADPLIGFDRTEVVKAGLVEWSYDAPRDDAKLKASEDTRLKVARLKQVDELDDEALEFLATEVMRLTRPAFFQTPEEREADTKNA